jgi:U3 small nucleolar RNA-associated protein 14
VEAPKVARGWNEWAGDGVSESGFAKRQDRAAAFRKQKIEELKKARADSKLKGVILSSVEERDKKFAQKFWVKDLPHPFKNVKQFEALMSVPLGKDWNTIQSHKRLIQPDVLTKAGTIIKPLKYKKDIPLQTIEALVQHRQEKKEKRPAAKF